jgi:hypothetical protein
MALAAEKDSRSEYEGPFCGESVKFGRRLALDETRSTAQENRTDVFQLPHIATSQESEL